MDGDAAEQTVKFARADESQTVRFQVKPGPATPTGAFTSRAIAEADGQTYDARIRGDRVPAHPPLSHLRCRPRRR